MLGRGGGQPSLRRGHLSWNLKDRRNRQCEEGAELSRQRPEASAKALRLESPRHGEYGKDGCVSGHK